MELLPRGPRAEPIAANEVGRNVAFYVLRAKVESVLYCADPCPNASEIFIHLDHVFPRDISLRELFIGKTQIFLLINRELAPGLALDLAGRWFAGTQSQTGPFFVSPDERSLILNLIQRHKRAG